MVVLFLALLALFFAILVVYIMTKFIAMVWAQEFANELDRVLYKYFKK